MHHSPLKHLLREHRHPAQCEYCGRSASECGEMTIDHIVAKSRRGSNTVTNLAWACKACNSSKSHLTIAEWLGGDLQRAMSVIRPLCVTKFPDGRREVVAQPDYERCAAALADAGLLCGRAVVWYAYRRVRENARIANKRVRNAVAQSSATK